MPRISRRRWLIVAAVLAVPLGFLGWFYALLAGSSAGSPKLAAEWRAELSAIESPDQAKARNRHVHVLHFPNGEWVMGLCADSHGIWIRGGGTIVVRDSRGEIRAYFGHVCGYGAAFFTQAKSVEEYHEQLKTHYVEHIFP